MTLLQYSIHQYLTKLRMSRRPTLLVEGRDDRRLFKLLIDASKHTFALDAGLISSVIIDTATIISSDGNGIFGNREKVEHVSQLVVGHEYEARFVGFVDREFREFQIGTTLKDNIRKHKRTGRLVWSRGHSVENYFFDFSILREPLRDFSVSDYFDLALDLLEVNFEKIIQVACALTLAARGHALISLVRGSIDWRYIRFDSGMPYLDIDAWKTSLQRDHHLNEGQASDLISGYEEWLNVVRDSVFEVARWLCHGHIGLAIIWAVYSKCVFEACSKHGTDDPNKEAGRVLKAEESVRFNACASKWANKALGGHTDSPMLCLQMLGVLKDLTTPQ